MGGLLVALRMKGETVDEMVGAARAMRARMVRVPFEGDVLDTCGTGGDGSQSVNISTIASFIVAGAGVVVAKHGNRAQSSRSGSHDVIEALGLDPAPSPELAVRCLREAKLAFLFAPAHHAATRHVVGPRRELGLRTLFNMLGPLTNPCGARFHMNGIFSRQRCEPLARAHALLGSERALVVHGAGNLDEIAPAGKTHVAELRDGVVRTLRGRARRLRPRRGRPGRPARRRARLQRQDRDRDAGRRRRTRRVRNAALMAAGAALYVVGQRARPARRHRAGGGGAGQWRGARRAGAAARDHAVAGEEELRTQSDEPTRRRISGRPSPVSRERLGSGQPLREPSLAAAARV